MIIDKFTKAVMTLLAVSLFMIALNPWIAPTKAYAEVTNPYLQGIENAIDDVAKAIKRIDCSR
jgi:hypothetical protein